MLICYRVIQYYLQSIIFVFDFFQTLWFISWLFNAKEIQIVPMINQGVTYDYVHSKMQIFTYKILAMIYNSLSPQIN